MNASCLRLSLCLAALLPQCLLGAEPPTTPILRIEAGMHTAPINRISMDAAGRVVLTASDDKTARLWRLPDLKPPISGLKSQPPLCTFRIPMDEGDEGKLYACALSPDGMLAALGGWTGHDWDKTHWVYLFDTATGRLVRRLEGLPEVIKDLAFSKQGRFLATVLGVGKGLRVWEVASGREVGRDTDYGACGSYGVDWQGEERLVTTSYDGFLRLYHVARDPRAVSLTPGGKAQVKGGKEPYSARFSPDGRQIAVGFRDSTAVTVVDGADLHFLFAPDTAGLDNGNMVSVTWSHDGSTLAAGGAWQKLSGDVWHHPIRLWPQSGRGAPRDVASASNVIMDLRPLPDGGIAFGAGDPAWGVLNGAGRRTLWNAPPLADYRGMLENFRLSADGTVVVFGFQPLGASPARFSVAQRELANVKDGPARPELLHAPRLDGLKVDGWNYTMTPTLDGRPLALEREEMALSLAVARDASSFLLGFEWYLRSYTARGAERWKVPVPGIVWAVNLTTNDQLAVAAHGDGTIRWHQADTGRELLAFYPHADRKRWVLWTPQGYYDCSPGAEELLGWHVNRGKDEAADFFPVARFRAIYYRPDVIQRVLRTRDVTQAVRQANAVLGLPDNAPAKIADVVAALSPPVVELTTGGILREVMLPPGAKEFELGYRVRQTGAQPATKVEIRAAGRPLPVKAPAPRDGEEISISVPLPEWFEGEISVIASHLLARSEAATLRVRRSSPPRDQRAPNLFVISAGVSQLAMNLSPQRASGSASGSAKDRFANLEFAADDAKKVSAVLAAQQGRVFGQVEAHVLLDEQATTAALRKAIHEVSAKAGLGDVLFFFFSGHGNPDPKTGKFHLVTHDTDPKREAETAFSGEELSQLLGQVRGYVVVALDACHSGAVLGMQLGEKYKAPPLDISGLANQLSSAEHGIVVLSSSTPDQVSFEDRELGGGLFTKALLEGLGGKAASGGTVTCAGLMKWIDQRMPQLTGDGGTPSQEDITPQQTPVTVMPGSVPDFTLAHP